MRDDFEALGSVTERERPELDRTMRAAQLRQKTVRAARKEWLMSAVTVMKRRPWIVTAAAAIAIALVLLAVPISYERTTGHQVNLTIAGELETPRAATIARELKSALHAEQVAVRLENGTTVLSAFLPLHAGSNAPALAQAFAKELETKGYHASAATLAVKERTSGNVYAFARDRMITVESAGKSAAQLEAEIRQRFAEAGVPDAKVSVTDQPGGQREVKVEMHQEHEGTNPDQAPDLVGLQLTKNGVPLRGGQQVSVKCMKLKGSDGSTTLRVIVEEDGRSVTAEVKNPESLGDAATAAEIQRQISAAGIQARVTVQNGQVRIEQH